MSKRARIERAARRFAATTSKRRVEIDARWYAAIIRRIKGQRGSYEPYVFWEDDEWKIVKRPQFLHKGRKP